MLDHFMQKLAKELEIEGSFATEVPGAYAFPLDEGLTVMITEIPRGFSFSCDVVECPTGNEEEFYTQAMLANLFGQGTEGCILGTDGDGALLTLSKDVDHTIDYNEFRDLLEDFVNAAEFWRQEAPAYGMENA